MRGWWGTCSGFSLPSRFCDLEQNITCPCPSLFKHETGMPSPLPFSNGGTHSQQLHELSSKSRVFRRLALGMEGIDTFYLVSLELTQSLLI